MNAVARFFTIERTAAVMVLAIASWQLLLPPVLGLADNGDFARVMVFFDLTHEPKEWGDRYFGFLDRHYVFDRVEAGKYAARDFISSELVLVATAVVLNRFLNPTTFDVLLLGAVQVLVLVLSVYFLLVASKSLAGRIRTAGVVLGALVFTDICYIAYFNSFFTESASFLFLLMTAACAYGAMTCSRRRMAWITAYLAAAAALLLAKYQNLVLLPFFLAFGWLLLRRQAEIKHLQIYLVIALVVCYGAYQFSISSPAVADEAVIYNSIFDGILRDSPTPQQDLAAIGLNPDMARYVGTNAFHPDSPRYDGEFMAQFRGKVSLGGLALFYLRRPRRLAGALNRTIALAFLTRPPELGNYEKIRGHAPGAQSKSWAMWSSLRAAVLPRSLWFVLAVCFLHLGLLTKKWWQQTEAVARLNLEWSALFVPMALTQLLLLAVFNGTSELTRHAFLFNLLFDYLLLAIAAQIIAWLAMPSARGEVKEAVA